MSARPVLWEGWVYCAQIRRDDGTVTTETVTAWAGSRHDAAMTMRVLAVLAART